LYSLVVLCETNVLNLISQRLDTIYQIKPKHATVLFLHLFAELNTAIVAADVEISPVLMLVGQCRKLAILGLKKREYTGRIRVRGDCDYAWP
jgi:hypothetical protein